MAQESSLPLGFDPVAGAQAGHYPRPEHEVAETPGGRLVGDRYELLTVRSSTRSRAR